MLDTNVFDALIADWAVADRARRVARAGALRFETSEVQEGELGRLRGIDRARHRRADRIPRSVVPAAPAGDVPDRDRRDARIAATALRDGRALVTDDRALRARAAALGVTVWDAAALIALLGELDRTG